MLCNKCYGGCQEERSGECIEEQGNKIDRDMYAYVRM